MHLPTSSQSDVGTMWLIAPIAICPYEQKQMPRFEYRGGNQKISDIGTLASSCPDIRVVKIPKQQPFFPVCPYVDTNTPGSWTADTQMIIIIIIMMMIIIAFKGAVRDFLQSPHCAANRL